jgi:hypothetical protein
MPSVPDLKIEKDPCPKCGTQVIYGYGLMGGGIGPYRLCPNDDCDFFEKTQDAEETERPD